MFLLFSFYSKIAESLRILGRAAFFVAGFHWIKIKGKPASEQEAGILVIAPHSSWLDVIVMFSLGSMPMPISRQENFSDPLIGRKSFVLVIFCRLMILSRTI